MLCDSWLGCIELGEILRVEDEEMRVEEVRGNLGAIVWSDIWT